MKMDRRSALGISGAAVVGAAATLMFGRQTHAAPGKFPVAYTDAEWRKRLSPRAYAVLRQENTEPAGSSSLNREKRRGTYHCAGCDLPVYSSATKFESGTGWPSFLEAAAERDRDARGQQALLQPDRSALPPLRRASRPCFRRWPEATGLRYCMNGLALKFRPA
jgi:peptide-methionine (R)-S-oxide reductase